MPPEPSPSRLLPDRHPFARLTRAIAIAGGLITVAAALVVTASVSGRWLEIGSIQGDFDIVKIAVAVSVFCFLPFTQIRRANITVDTFTSRLPASASRAIDAFWDLVLAALIAVLAWSMAQGAREALASGLASMVLGVPLGPVFVACAALLVLLAGTAVATAVHLLRGRR